MPNPPTITVDPRVQLGRPNIGGTPTGSIAAAVAAGESFSEVAATYGRTRHEVILACWYEGMQGSHRRLWTDWAGRVHAALGGREPLDVDAVREPPAAAA